MSKHRVTSITHNFTVGKFRPHKISESMPSPKFVGPDLHLYDSWCILTVLRMRGAWGEIETVMKVNLTKSSEFDFQARLYCTLRDFGFDVRGEIKIILSDGRKIRADLVIVENNKIVGLVEVKKSSRCKRDTKQVNKYRSLSLPFIHACGSEDFQTVVNWAFSLASK